MLNRRPHRLTELGGGGIYSVGWPASAVCTERESTVTNTKEIE